MKVSITIEVSDAARRAIQYDQTGKDQPAGRKDIESWGYAILTAVIEDLLDRYYHREDERE